MSFDEFKAALEEKNLRLSVNFGMDGPLGERFVYYTIVKTAAGIHSPHWNIIGQHYKDGDFILYLDSLVSDQRENISILTGETKSIIAKAYDACRAVAQSAMRNEAYDACVEVADALENGDNIACYKKAFEAYRGYEPEAFRIAGGKIRVVTPDGSCDYSPDEIASLTKGLNKLAAAQ